MSWWRKLFGRGGEKGENEASHPQNAPRGRTPREEYEIARSVFEKEGDPRHAAHHLAEALAADPTDPGGVRLLDELVAAAGDPDQLVSESDRGYYAVEALRAYALQRQGRIVEAVDLLLAIARAKPDSLFLEAWLLDWLDEDETLLAIEPERMAYVAAVAVLQFPEANELRARPRRWLERLLSLLDRYRASRVVDATFRLWRTAILRKLGRYDEALSEAERLYEDHPEWQTAVAVANVHRHRGDDEAAIAAFQQALSHEPDDVSARNDLGDLHMDRGDWSRALSWYDQVLEREKSDSWALPSALFCRMMLAPEEGASTAQLQKLIEGPEPNERSMALLATRSPYWGFLPEPTDALANVLRQVIEAAKNGQAISGEFRITVSSLEAPSNFLAFTLQMHAMGKPCVLDVTVERIPSPDPRATLGPVEYLLWEYEGTDARPALPAPSAEVAEWIAGLAARPYRPGVNWNEAGVVAERLGVERVNEVVAAMVHPPALPSGSALSWLPRVQLAAAQVIAQIDAGWRGSVRRRALLDLARGPRDWATTAVLLALAQLARQENDPAINSEVREVFGRLLEARPGKGHPQAAYIHPLLSSWLDLPDVSDAERKKLLKLLRELDG